jgi:hypothetical protein
MKESDAYALAKHSYVLTGEVIERNSARRFLEMFAGVLVFSVIVVIISALFFRRYEKMEKAETITYIVLIAWGSLFWGLFLSKCAR